MLFGIAGRGIGPAFVANLIVKLGGRRKAFNVGIFGWFLCGILNGLLYFTVEQDEEAARININRVVYGDIPNEKVSCDFAMSNALVH